MSEGYNGWSNYETWNVALYMDNDEQSYALARTCKNYKEYQFFNLTHPRNTTPDGVSLFDPKLDIKELDEKIQEYRQGHSPYTTWRQDRVDAVEGALGDYPEDCGW